MFSDVPCVIMGTMVEVAQRILTNLPTVPRTSESGIWPSASKPTRARAPRTEITRPNDVTGILPALHMVGLAHTMLMPAAQTVKPRGTGTVQIRSNFAQLAGLIPVECKRA